jgi:hypothetical protein
MSDIHPLLEAFLSPGDTDINNMQFPKPVVEKMLETNKRLYLEKGHKDEREEIVCRLLGSGMSAEEISLILKIRIEDILDIERYNRERIIDYGKKLKTRRKSRERRKD